MQDRIADIEARLTSIEQRLDALDGGPAQAPRSDDGPAEPMIGDGFANRVSVHVGRVMLIFGGAYLLRAMTDFQFVQTGLGILTGVSYALFWLYLAYRNGRGAGPYTSAMIYGGISVVLTMPLLVEASNHFQLLSGNQSVAALTVYCVLTLGVAYTRNLRSIAWITTAGAIPAAIMLTVGAHSAFAAAVFLMLLALSVLWISYRQDWHGPQWLGAVGANIGVIAIVVLGMNEQWSINSRVAAFFGIVLLLAYLVSFAIQSHVRGNPVSVFEAVQALAASAIAFWASSVAVAAGQFGYQPVGIMSVLLGAGAYALAFTPRTRDARGRTFFYYSTLGLVYVLAGTAWVLPVQTAAVLWATMAIAVAWASGRSGWVSLSGQCTILLVAAGVHSGLLMTGLTALVGDPSAAWPTLSAAHLLIAFATVACLFIPVAQQSERWGTLAKLPQLVVLVLSVWEVGGLMVLVAAPLIAGARSGDANLAILAALRTAVLSAASVTLALSSCHPRWPEARWLVYPMLIVVAVKLFAEDFPHGQAASLFVALAFVGSALLLVARFVGRSREAAERVQPVSQETSKSA